MRKIDRAHRILEQLEKCEPLAILANALMACTPRDDKVEKLRPALGWALMTLIHQAALLAAYEVVRPPPGYAGEVYRLHREILKDLRGIRPERASPGVDSPTLN